MSRRGSVDLVPHVLIDTLLKKFGFTTDSQLAEKLEFNNSTISKIRNGYTNLTAETTLRIYDRTDLTIEEIRELEQQQYKQGEVK